MIEVCLSYSASPFQHNDELYRCAILWRNCISSIKLQRIYGIRCIVSWHQDHYTEIYSCDKETVDYM